MPQIVRNETLEKLIDLVRENDYIYNISNRRHADSYLIESFWKDVADKLNIEDMDGNAWQKRWRNMRDSYVKHKKKLRGEDVRPNYKFARQMEFLDSHLPATKLLRLYDELEEERSISDREDVKYYEVRSNSESQDPQSPEGFYSEDNSNLRQSMIHQSSTPLNAVEHSNRVYTNYRHDHQDADMLLFESYALRLKALPTDSQAVVKMQISQIFFNAENTTGDSVDIFPSRKRKIPSNHSFQENEDS